MSSSNHHFLAILPLFAILSISPMHLDSKIDTGRSIASEVVLSQPKYEARAAKIDRTKIVVDKDLDLNCYNDREESFRKRLLEVRDAYKVEATEKEIVSLQKSKVESLVSSLVDLEEDKKVLKDKKAFPVNDPSSDVAMRDFKIILEGLLEDELKNDGIVAKAEAAKEEAPQVATTKPEVKPEAETPAKEEPKKEDDALCDLQEKNLVLTKQVEDLLAQQKTIMQNMMSMTQMMVEMHQRSQMLPSWMTNGSMMSQPQQQYPTVMGSGNGQWVFYPQSTIPSMSFRSPVAQPQAWEPNVQTQLGQGTYQQAASSQFNYQPIPQPSIWNNAVSNMSYMPATFGSSPSSFNFSQNTNQAVNFGV